MTVSRVLASVCLLTLLGGCKRSISLDEFMARGQRLMEQKDYVRAALEFQNAVQIAPNGMDANYSLGLAYFQGGRVADAYNQFKKVVSLNPRHADAHLKLAQLMLIPHDRGLAARAEEHLQNVLALRPADNDALFYLSRARVELGKPEEAMKYLRSLNAKAPAYLNAALALAQTKLENGDRSGAEETLKKTLAEKPPSADAHSAMGAFYVASQQDAAAEPQFREALKIDPKQEQSLVQMAALLVRTGRTKEAGEFYKTISALNRPELKPAYAIYLLRFEDTATATKEFERLYRESPADRAARDRLITLYVATKRTPEALKMLNEALAKNNKDVTALVGRAGIIITAGDIEGARRDADAALHLDPNSAAGYYVRSRVHNQDGQASARRRDLEQALRLEPTLLAARLELADVYLQGEAAELALQTLDGATPDQKKTPAYIVVRNWALIGKGNVAAARDQVKDAMAKFPGAEEFILQDGVIRTAERDYDGARASLSRVLEVNPDDGRAVRALMRTYELQNRPKDGLAAVKQHVESHGSALGAQLIYAAALIRGGEKTESRRILTHLNAVRPDPTAEMLLAKLDVEEGKPSEARPRLQAVVKANSRSTEAALMLGMVDESLSRASDAINSYRRVLALDPSNVVALNNLAGLLAREDASLDEALTYAQKAKELAPEESYVSDTLGWIFYRKGFYSRAVRELEAAVKKAPRPAVQYHLGLAYLKTGETSRGNDLVAAALKSNPGLVKTEGAP